MKHTCASRDRTKGGSCRWSPTSTKVRDRMMGDSEAGKVTCVASSKMQTSNSRLRNKGARAALKQVTPTTGTSRTCNESAHGTAPLERIQI